MLSNESNQQILLQPQSSPADQRNTRLVGVAVGCTFICIAITFAIFNLAFIIPDLVFAGQ